MVDYLVGIIATTEDYFSYLIEADSEDEAESIALDKARDESPMEAILDVVEFKELN